MWLEGSQGINCRFVAPYSYIPQCLVTIQTPYCLLQLSELTAHDGWIKSHLMSQTVIRSILLLAMACYSRSHHKSTLTQWQVSHPQAKTLDTRHRCIRSRHTDEIAHRIAFMFGDYLVSISVRPSVQGHGRSLGLKVFSIETELQLKK